MVSFKTTTTQSQGDGKSARVQFNIVKKRRRSSSGNRRAAVRFADRPLEAQVSSSSALNSRWFATNQKMNVSRGIGQSPVSSQYFRLASHMSASVQRGLSSP